MIPNDKLSQTGKPKKEKRGKKKKRTNKRKNKVKSFTPGENAGHELWIASIYCRHFCHFRASLYQLHLTDTKCTFYSNKLQIPAFQLYSKICIINNLSTIHLALGISLTIH